MALGDGRVRGARRGTQGGGPVQKLKLGLTHGFERRLWFQIVKKKNCELKTILLLVTVAISLFANLIVFVVRYNNKG